MLRKFLPRNYSFFDFFDKHSAGMVEGAKGLLLFLNPQEDPRIVYEHIKLHEIECDQIAHNCIDTLHKTFITPIERGDIYRLITTMDDVMDEIEEVARCFALYKLKEIREEAKQLIHLIVQATQEVENAVKELKKMKRSELLKGHFKKINQLENEADGIFTDALSRLFDEEKDAATLIKWKQVFETLESTTDICEDISNILEGILLEYE